MAADAALVKRIKRHVTGRVREYFAATAPGFETICREELTALSAGVKDIETAPEIVPGGVRFKGRLIDCWRANLHLRTANRILMRLCAFQAANFHVFEKHLADVPWELYLVPETPVRCRVSTRHCRLYHKIAIAERVQAAVDRRFGRTAPAPETDAGPPPQHLFIRGSDDRWTVSIDSSGDLLYKRGVKVHGGRAPLRETVAAAALLRAGYSGNMPLVDPMCGTGTFSLEAALIAAETPPGLRRRFAFMDWPSFSVKRWDHLVREAESSTSPPPEKPMIFASDRNPGVCDALQGVVAQAGLAAFVHLRHRDFFATAPADFSDTSAGKGLVVLNPPYGRRIGTPEQSVALFRRVCRHLTVAYAGWRLALVLPEGPLADSVPFRTEALWFLNGGMKMMILTGTIPG